MSKPKSDFQKMMNNYSHSFESSKYQVLYEKDDMFLESWDGGEVRFMKKNKNGMAFMLGSYYNFRDAKVALDDYAGGDNYYCQQDFDFEDENFGDECYVTEYYRGEYE